jgi:hypothetical protein
MQIAKDPATKDCAKPQKKGPIKEGKGTRMKELSLFGLD